MGKCQYCKWLMRDDLYIPIEPKEVENMSAIVEHHLFDEDEYDR